MSVPLPDIDQAVALHQQGRLDEAERIYRRLLADRPQDAQVTQLLGLAAYQRGNLKEAAELIEAAIRARPEEADFHNNLGEVYRGLGRPAEAAACYGRALELAPTYTHAHNNLGLARKALGDRPAARLAFQAALRIEPDYAEAWTNLGVLEQELGNSPEAILSFERAVTAQPGFALAQTLLGEALRQRGLRADALRALQTAVRLAPDSLDACYFLGLALLEDQQLEAAAKQFSRVVALRPNFSEAHNALGACVLDLGQLDRALVHFDQAIRLKADFGAAHLNRGNVLKQQHQYEAAIASYQLALRASPNYAGTHFSLGSAYEEAGDIERALDCHRRAVALEPGSPFFHSNLLLALHYHPGVQPAEFAAEHARWAERHAHPLRASIRPQRTARGSRRRLRIGYVSPDFRDHVVLRFLLPLLQHRQGDVFEVYAYSAATRPDAVTDQVKALVDGWRDLRTLTDAQAAELIRADEIDILVDLAGHTGGNRLLTFALKPAPLQVSWLGYPNTTGLATIEYRMVDGWSDPEGMTDRFYAEKLWRLPDTAWCYRPLENLADPEPSPRLAAGKVAFGSFNRLAKLSSQSIELWAEILRGVPRSTLVLKARGLADAAVRREVTARFERTGIAGERLAFSPWTETAREHVEYHRNVDLALDTFPYHGTTTTCEALWMGVPVVTLAGDMHHSRVGVSLLTNVGLPELIARTPEEYVRIAVELANDPRRLTEIRLGLRARMAASPLRNEGKFARQFEAALSAMWERQIGT